MSIIRQKYKFDRTIGANLFGRKKSPIFKRNYRPGQHGNSKMKRKISEFGEKVLEAKKVKLFYGGLRYKDLRRIVLEGINSKGNSTDNIVKILESRLASVIYRAKFGATPFASKQMVNHGHVCVNGQKVDIPSYRVSVGDKITLSKEMFNNSHVKAAIASDERELPVYLTVKNEEIIFTEANINNTKFPIPMEFIKLIEFFNR